MIKDIKKAIADMRKDKPLVLILTNYVTMDFVANCMLALGSAPVMSTCTDELDELISISSSININIGTLNSEFIKLSIKAIELAEKHIKPIVLDPVGSGATKIRTQTAKLFAQSASIIRGNASEIIALSGGIANTKGVESTGMLQDAKLSANEVAEQHKCIVAASGSIDYITDGSKHIEIPYGSELMPLITGMGCALTAVIAAFHAISRDPFTASRLGTLYFALCGEIAERNTNHPASFRTTFIDTLHSANFEAMEEIYVK